MNTDFTTGTRHPYAKAHVENAKLYERRYRAEVAGRGKTAYLKSIIEELDRLSRDQDRLETREPDGTDGGGKWK